jgi:hypothetical protein
MDRIERSVAKHLAKHLEAHDFRLRPEWNGFVRETSYGCDQFLIVNQGTAQGRFFEMKCYPAIRHDRIEVAWNSFGFIYGEDAQRQTATLTFTNPRGSLPLMKIAPASQVTDTQAVADETLRVFAEKALPFYQRYSDLAVVEELVNRSPLTSIAPYIAGGGLDHLAVRSLLLAKCANPPRFEAVREACLASTLKPWWSRERFEQSVSRVAEMVV